MELANVFWPQKLLIVAMCNCWHRCGSLVSVETGKLGALACQYHSWTHDLVGAFKFVTDEHEFPALDKNTHGLVPLRRESFGNLIFVNRDMNAQPLVDYLGKTGREIAHFDLECNWKVAIDAFAQR